MTDPSLAGLPRAAALVARLCAIPSPSRNEGDVAAAVLDELAQLGASVEQDDAAQALPAGCNNIVARFEPTVTGGTPICFCAHLDTVPNNGPIDVVLRDGFLTNSHDDILGGDNKAAVGAILEAVRRVIAHDIPHAGIEVLFTPCEEIGLRGAAHFDPSRLRSSLVFVFDHTGPLGGIVTAAPSLRKIAATFVGRTSHAGIAPENGRSAIVAAARAVSRMPHGRLDDGSTVNVGTVAGGTATNVVAERCDVLAEARSLDEATLSQCVMDMLDAFTWAATETEVDCQVDVVHEFTGYRLSSQAPEVMLARSALEACGFEPTEVTTGGGSDTNAFIDNGLASVNLCNDMIDVHTGSERIAVASIESTVDLVLALIEQARGASSNE